ncbi:MAG: uroporphyrinogen decarboxylase family protein [Desulfobacterales bacterium]|nr:uroporphyrinogen decarboxylase family protein [Desulfobacterales bacterium]
MNKIERIDAVLAGHAPDRPPVSLWYHFGLQHAGGDGFARASLDYFDHYDFDFLKVMNDYFYPAPAGVDTVCGPEDLRQFGPFDPSATGWRKQLKAIEAIQAALDGRAYFVDTVFDPWQSLRRGLAGENMERLMRRYPEALTSTLQVITDNLIAYCRESLARGAAGIFLSVAAGSEILPREDFLAFVKPHAARLLEAIAGQAVMNTAHIHGDGLFFDDVLDLPVPVFNWWDRGPQGPDLAAIRDQTDACLMGGIDQTLVARRSRRFLRAHVQEGLAAGGNRRFFLANGCTIASWVYPEALHAIVDTVKAAGDSPG